jgi:nucleoside 2-deoxyribosyltransferase
MVNGEFRAKIQIDPAKFVPPASPPNCHAALVVRFLDPSRFYAFGIGGWGYEWSAYFRHPSDADYSPWQVGGRHGDERNRSRFEYDIAVRIEGSVIDCRINDSRVFVGTIPGMAHYKNGQLGLYAYDDTPVTFSEVEAYLAPLTAFIVSPINPQFDQSVYQEVEASIKALKIGDHFVECLRADKLSRSEPFIRTIVEEMKRANVTVVLLPGTSDEPDNRNENVFYELGMAHALGLPTIIYAASHMRVPADLRHLNIITSKDKLVDAVREVLSKDQYHQIFVA